MNLTFKLLQYVSYKLVTIMKLADSFGFNAVTGEILHKTLDEQEVEKLAAVSKQDRLT
jgi:hypothetical protein